MSKNHVNSSVDACISSHVKLEHVITCTFGCTNGEMHVYQDNKSSIRLETNGRGSSGKRTRHMNVRYFFIADRVKSKEIRIEYCPTGIMVADYFTKALQGMIFKQLRDMIMGNTVIALPADAVTSPVDMTNQSPALVQPQESRSVLRCNDAANDSPRSLTVLSARKQPMRAHMRKTSTEVLNPSNLVMGNQAISWAAIVSR
jgi:hypothetical protein